MDHINKRQKLQGIGWQSVNQYKMFQNNIDNDTSQVLTDICDPIDTDDIFMENCAQPSFQNYKYYYKYPLPSKNVPHHLWQQQQLLPQQNG